LQDLGIPLRESKFALKEEEPKKWRQYLLGVWSRNQDEPGVAELYQSKLWIVRDLLRQWVEGHPGLKLPVTFDNWYTQPAFCRYLDKDLELPYIGMLANDNIVILQKGHLTLEAFADQLKQEHLQAVEEGGKPVFHKIGIPYKGEKETYYSYCHNHRIKNFGKQRLVISFSHPDLSDSPNFYNSNRLYWQSVGITRIRRHRRPVETYHGAAPHHEALLEKLQHQLEIDLDGSVPFWRRATKAQSLWTLACFLSAGLSQGHSLRSLMAPLLASVCY
jgi:hypothetical protein